MSLLTLSDACLMFPIRNVSCQLPAIRLNVIGNNVTTFREAATDQTPDGDVQVVGKDQDDIGSPVGCGPATPAQVAAQSDADQEPADHLRPGAAKRAHFLHSATNC